MTAQIAIMNKEAVALASDSAVTIREERGQKTFTSANKLFTLSKYQPVGIMAYGTAEFMEVPWETIIKIYRAELDEARFNTFGEYAENFIAFLDNGNLLFPEAQQRDNLRATATRCFNEFRKTIKNRVQSILEKGKGVSKQEAVQIAADVIEGYRDWLLRLKTLPSLPEGHMQNILDKYSDAIEEARDKVFKEQSMPDTSLQQLKEIAAGLFCKDAFPPKISQSSGVIIAGFGQADSFPSIFSFRVESVVDNRLKYKEMLMPQISFENPAAIIPFAQAEMVSTFMEGIDPSLHKFTQDYLSKAFHKFGETILERVDKYDDNEKGSLRETLKAEGDKLFQNYQQEMQSRKVERFVAPIVKVVTMLPKDELAAMAESLVSLTSFKRRVTMDAETVAGPIDVAVISKGDGFIWIKRKHYFRPELNRQFFANYYRR